jgi:hypothetical protein
VSAENFNAELGRDLAYQDALRKVRLLMGFTLRNGGLPPEADHQTPRLVGCQIELRDRLFDG